jgi:predicted HNH restriction endonuclease
MREYCIDNIPNASFYYDGFVSLGDRVTPFRRSILVSHYYATNHRATAPQLAALVGASHHSTINAQYGGLGRAFCELTGFDPLLRPNDSSRWWSVWSKGYTHPDGFIWEMHNNVSTALERLGWVDSSTPPLIPDELPADQVYKEGSRVEIFVSAYERNRSARKACLNHYGFDCVVCGFNFRSVYGSSGDGYIHVHHITPMCEIGDSYVVDPIADLRPVCPNCHAMIHRTTPPMSIDGVKQLLACRDPQDGR